jgi:hypothetical protein
MLKILRFQSHVSEIFTQDEQLRGCVLYFINSKSYGDVATLT